MKKKISHYLNDNRIHFLMDHEIKEFLTMHVGGKMGFIIFPHSSSEFSALLKFLHGIDQKFIVIGGGSNIVFPEHGDNMVVIRNNASEIAFSENKMLKVNTGVKNSDFLDFCKKERIGGFEFLAGIPGTIGGATAVNAGAFGNSISDRIYGGDIFTSSGNTEFKSRDYFEFSYRNSKFKYGDEVIIDIYLKFETGDDQVIRNRINEIIKLRLEKHPPYSAFTAGCFFKNPEVDGKKISAGKLIEECCLKGHDTGTAMISEKHSNFIVNKGNAVFSDIEALGEMIRETVKDKNGISLEREVIFVSPRGEKF